MPTGLGDEQLWISATNDNTGSSTAFNDQSGNGNDGTANGGMLVVADTGDGGTYAFDNNSTNQFVQVSGTIGTTFVSTSLWVKRTAKDNATTWFCGLNAYSSPAWSDAIYSYSGTDYARAGDAQTGISPALPSSGDWFHLVTVSDGGTTDIYVDGVLHDSVATTSPSATTEAFYLGASLNSTVNSSKYYDDIRVYDRVLTLAEIEYLSTARGIEGTPQVIEHSFSNLQSFPSDTLDLTVQAGCDLYIIGFIEGQVNRFLTGLSDNVQGAWDSFDTLYEGVNTLPKTWVGRVANHAGGEISITPAFNATASNLGAIMVLELRGYQFKSETSYDNTARLGTLIAAASPVSVTPGDLAIASHSVNANITPTYSETGWNHLTLQSGSADRSFLSTREPIGNYDFEVTNASNRYGAGSFALYEPVGGGPAAPIGLGGEQLWLCPTINNSANDISGNGYAGNYVNGMGTVASTGSGGTRAYSMNGLNQLINNLGQADWDFITQTGVFSISIWGKNNSASVAGQQTLISTDYDSVGTGFGLASVVGVGQEFFLTKTVGGAFAGRTTQNVTTGLNSWHLYTITGDGTNQRMYVDGVQVDVEAFAGPFSTATQSKPLEIGSYNSGSLLWNGEIDDVRIFDRAITLAEINHLVSARGVQGGPTTLGVSLRANASYVTDTDGFDVCTPNNGGAGNKTDDYSAAQGFGMIAGTYNPANFRDRSTTLPTQLAGMTFQSTNGATFRMDLPEGAGEYKVWFAGFDAAAAQATGWRFKDGTGGTEFATLDKFTSTTQYVDINNDLQLASAFDVAGSNYIQRTFTNDHFTIVRDTSLAGNNGAISSVWVEYVGTTPPTSGFYNPFTSYTFFTISGQRIR